MDGEKGGQEGEAQESQKEKGESNDLCRTQFSPPGVF